MPKQSIKVTAPIIIITLAIMDQDKEDITQIVIKTRTLDIKWSFLKHTILITTSSLVLDLAV